jgi:hypothetical protein
LGTQLPPKQYLPTSHCTLSLQFPKHAVGPQLKGVQVAVFLALQLPAASHTERKVSTPEVHDAAMHSVDAPG